MTTAKEALLNWHALHGRHTLPWRQGIDPYAVLVSEFMLQQTTVATVEPRFAEWMNRFPSLRDLAAATEQEVLSAWQGLGYYSRARRLHAAARAIMEQHDGLIPKDEKLLLALPGIGDYTASAIRAFAYDEQALVLDTNITRVLARWGNLTIPIDSAEGKKALREIALKIYPRKQCRAMATALMDLGAMLCTSGMPECSHCPLQKTCLAEQPEILPRKSPRALTSKLTEFRACFYRQDRLYLEQSQGPRWHGLWILPELKLGETKTQGLQGRPLAEIVYPITRYRITMKVYRTRESPPTHLHGFTTEELQTIPMPSPHRRAIAKICKAIGKMGPSSHT